MTTAIKEIHHLRAEVKAHLDFAKSIFEKGDKATLDQVDEARRRRDEAKSIAERLVGTSGPNMLDALKSCEAIETSLAVLGQQVDRPPLDGTPAPPIGGDGAALDRKGQLKTAGDLVIHDPRMNSYLKSLGALTPGGRIAERTAIVSPPVKIEAGFLKALYTSAVDAAAGRPMLGQADRRAELVRLGWTPLVLRDLITQLTTTSDLVEVVRERTQTNNAAVVPEATSAVAGGTGTKPESGLDWEVIQTPVKTIAHWLPVTTRALEDQDRLRGEIDAFLNSGVSQAFENAALNGVGASGSYDGVYSTTGTLTQPFVALATPALSLLTVTRRARTTLRVTGRAIPTAYLFHPADWEAIDLLQDAEQRFYFGGPWVMGTPRLWGLPVVESEYATPGLGVLADWRDAVVYDRQQTVITMSNQHLDFFVKNLVAVLAEMRAAFHIRRPRSFITVDLAA